MKRKLESTQKYEEKYEKITLITEPEALIKTDLNKKANAKDNISSSNTSKAIFI